MTVTLAYDGHRDVSWRIDGADSEGEWLRIANQITAWTNRYAEKELQKKKSRYSKVKYLERKFGKRK